MMRRERLAKGKLIRLLRLIFLVILITSVWIILANRVSSKTIISPLSSSVLTSDLPFQDSQTKSGLSDVVGNALKDAKGDYAVVISNFKTGESYSLNEHKIFEAGSLYKLWVMGAVYEHIQLGTFKKDAILSEDITVLNEKFHLATESAELEEGRIELPVDVALRRMITISDNYSALLLAWKLRLSKVSAFMDTKGFFESDLGRNDELPTTTAYDIALFFERLYRGQLADSKSTEEMIALLKAQQLNDKIPKLLPQNTTIAHKTGELGLVSHDGGIVYHPKGDYIIVVLSSSSRPGDAAERVAQISKSVFDYFSRK